ncbi:unnamed protein product, partial [Oppiella nova]
VANPEHIKLKVVDQAHNEIHYRVKVSAQFAKLKKSYSERAGVPLQSLRFYFDRRRIHDTDTPALLQMETDDAIEVYEEQVGGDGQHFLMVFMYGSNDHHNRCHPCEERVGIPSDMSSATGTVDGGAAADWEHIELKVLGQDSHETRFRVKLTTRLAKLKKSYAEAKRLQLRELRFLFDGHTIQDRDTPALLQMLNGDVIEVYPPQDGGDGGADDGNHFQTVSTV